MTSIDGNINRPSLWSQVLCLALQFLAAEVDAERLSQAGIPIISYSVRPWTGQLTTGGIHVIGPQSILTTIAKYQPVINNACDSLLANDTVLAQIEVRPHNISAHLTPSRRCVFAGSTQTISQQA